MGSALICGRGYGGGPIKSCSIHGPRVHQTAGIDVRPRPLAPRRTDMFGVAVPSLAGTADTQIASVSCIKSSYSY